MKKNDTYILDLTNCVTVWEVNAAIEADLNARKQLGCPKKKSLLRRIFGF